VKQRSMSMPIIAMSFRGPPSFSAKLPSWDRVSAVNEQDLSGYKV